MKHELEMKRLEFKEKAFERQHQDFVRIKEQNILFVSVDSVPAQYHKAFKAKQDALATKCATSWETPDFVVRGLEVDMIAMIKIWRVVVKKIDVVASGSFYVLCFI
ncbi:hypothetical protein FRX31_004175 [Thalictrum thalictroides]|uniref:Uncharacterized protein n=1 Tax=Thalictrum thalictroides TaxID=46969 RepID=A0A7J6XB84_THATH|nr:hypothetical protein FRX31_004175 [Thalictrum thalictroides]